MKKIFPLLLLSLLMSLGLYAQRIQQPLGRGVVAVQGTSNGSSAVEITWRRLAQEPEDAAYNIYVSKTAEGGYSLLNTTPLTNTNYATTLAKVPYGSYVAVSLVKDGAEGSLSKPFHFTNMGLRNLYMEISFKDSPLDKTLYTTKFVWPCDLNGDGEYDYVVNRSRLDSGFDACVEGYLADGTYLWTIDLGPNELSCSGQDDQICAYDIDCDGKGEVILQTSDGTRFWDAQNKTWGKYLLGKDTGDSDGDGIIDYKTQTQKNAPRYMTVADGMTGAEKATIEQQYDNAYNRTNKATLMGDEYCQHVGHVGIFYHDGIHPALVMEWHTRTTAGAHQYRNSAFAYEGGQWKQLFMKNVGGSEFHMIRIFDADGDGKDEMSSGAYVMDHDGSTLYNTGITHGDRHRTADIDPLRPGMETFAIQQNAPDMLGMILYDSSNGEPIKRWYLPSVGDVGRGECLDLDDKHFGWEMFSTMDDYQIYDARGNKIEGMKGYFPTEGIWWDGQLDRENVNSPDGNGYNAMIVDYKNGRLIEMAKESNWTIKTSYGKRGKYWGDIIGDWREELILIREKDGVCEGIVGFTTDYKTDVNNIYCLQQDPHYRGDCTTRGYYQTPCPAFYLGYDMPRPQLPPCMVSDEESDVFGIDLADGAEITPRSTVKNVYAMPVKGQTLSLAKPLASASATIWKAQMGRLDIKADCENRIVITEGTVGISTKANIVDLRARGTLAGNGTVNSVICEGALHYEGCRLMPETSLYIENITLAKGKKLYVELTPGVSHIKLSALQETGVLGDVVFNLPDDVAPGNYLLVDGGSLALDQLSVNGLNGKSYHLEIVDPGTKCGPYCQQVFLVVESQRQPAEGVVWTAAESNVWDYQAKNFSLDGKATNFIDGDGVIFDDTAENTTLTLNDNMTVSTAVFAPVSKSYTINGNGSIKGRTILKSGRLSVKELCYNFEIGKATLYVSNTNASNDNPVLLTDTATIYVPSGTMAQKGRVTGDGVLMKSGGGQLNITYAGANNFTGTILAAGTLAMGAWNTVIGKTTSQIHVTGNSTFTVFNNNSTSQVPTVQNVFLIDKGRTLTFHAGQRCSIKGSLQGEGVYKIDFPYVRGDVSTNMSQFEGVYEVTTQNCRFVQGIDLSKGTLQLDASSAVVSMQAGSGNQQNLTHKVGTLSGPGTLGNGTWNVNVVKYLEGPTIIEGTLKLDSPLIEVTKLGNYKGVISKDVQLFTVKGTVSISGEPSFLPAVPKEGYKWDFSTLHKDGVLRIVEDAAGIEGVSADGSVSDKSYTISGQRATGATKGIVIKGNKKVIHF